MRVRTGNPEMAREINRALVLHLFRNHEAISRVWIAHRLHISKVTVSTIVNDLMEKGYVLEIGEGSSIEKGGRRPIMLSLNTSSKFVVGVDLGTTNTVSAIGDLKGNVLKEKRVPTNRNHNVENVIGQVTHLVDETISESGIDRDKIVGLGMAVAGQVEKNEGLIIFSPHFNWNNVRIAELLEEKTGLKTVADNCTRVMAIGEMWFGEGKNIHNFIFINIGYGVGSAIVIDGKIYHHHSEFGHIFVTKNKVRCPCGKYGCLEVVASGNAIEKQANQHMIGRDKAWISAKMVSERALKGDSVAMDIYSETGRYLGRGISVLANSLDPEKIVIGGGVSLAGNLLMDPILKEFKENTIDVIKEKTEVRQSLLGIDAGVRGAIAMALNDIIFDFELVIR